jgi:streptogramin lyase
VSSQESKITPRISILSEKTYTIQPTSTVIEPENIEKISYPGTEGYSTLPLEKAYAVSSNQNTINVTQWNIPEGRIMGFDSQGNFFTADFLNKVGRGDIITENHTQWVLPNNDQLDSTLVVGSNDAVFFNQFDLDSTWKIGTLNHTTNTFTEWTVPNDTRPRWIAIDSSNNVFFFSESQESFGRLVPSTNTFTIWCCVSVNNDQDFEVDSSGNLLLVSTGTREIIQFTPSTKTITTWPTLSNSHIPYDVTTDSSGIIYFTEIIPTNTLAIAKLNPNNNSIKEWSIPDVDDLSSPSQIIVDSSNNIFFYSGDFGRLVPSNNTVTFWNDPHPGTFLDIDSLDTIFWSSGRQGGTIT